MRGSCCRATIPRSILKVLVHSGGMGNQQLKQSICAQEFSGLLEEAIEKCGEGKDRRGSIEVGYSVLASLLRWPYLNHGRNSLYKAYQSLDTDPIKSLHNLA